jgi:hypothetical protein
VTDRGANLPMGAYVTPGDLVALRAVQRQIPLDIAVYVRLEQLGLIVRVVGSPSWVSTPRGEVISPTPLGGQ